ncbi:vestitone reductase-like [Vitis vinifera]|uniref:vestitone reductase-like n=1 Tax=Vitis vinifera TaxID=29760 RepID=UPI0028832607|nr:vestitone reductase-like [Vitis vinifera]
MENRSCKVGLLQSLPNADTRLRLFKADIYNPDEFEQAIQGCEFVFHVATPLQHIEDSQYKNTAEAAVAGAKSIAVSCINSATVRRVIYTASVVAAAPLKDDETGFKDSMDESCWTPLNLPFSHGNSHLKASFSLTLMLNKILLEIQTVEREY